MEELSKEIMELLKNCTFEEKVVIIKNIINQNPTNKLD